MQADIEAFVADFTEETRNRILAADLHKTKPAYANFVVDDQSRVWVKTAAAELAQTTQWLVIDGNSRVRSVVTLQVGVSLRTVVGNRAYGVDRSEGATVVAYEIHE